MPDVVGEQYIEQPRALCNENSVPLKGQKSSVTKFYQSRYKESTLITHTLNSEWVPDSVIFDPQVHLTSFFKGIHPCTCAL